MNYKTDNEYWKDTLLFRCNCGEYAFIEISKMIYMDNTPEYSVCFIEEPRTFIQRLKWLFKPDKYVRELMLSADDIKVLIDNLSE